MEQSTRRLVLTAATAVLGRRSKQWPALLTSRRSKPLAGPVTTDRVAHTGPARTGDDRLGDTRGPLAPATTLWVAQTGAARPGGNRPGCRHGGRPPRRRPTKWHTRGPPGLAIQKPAPPHRLDKSTGPGLEAGAEVEMAGIEPASEEFATGCTTGLVGLASHVVRSRLTRPSGGPHQPIVFRRAYRHPPGGTPTS